MCVIPMFAYISCLMLYGIQYFSCTNANRLLAPVDGCLAEFGAKLIIQQS